MLHADAKLVIDVLAASVTPATMADIINDIESNAQTTARKREIAAALIDLLRQQLACLIGDSEADQLISPAVACDGCGRGTAKIGGECDHCGSLIECDPRATSRR